MEAAKAERKAPRGAAPHLEPEFASLSRTLTIVSAARIALVTGSLGASLASGDGAEATAWQYQLVGAAYTVSLVSAVALRLRVLVQPVAYALLFFDSLLVSLLVAMTGGPDSVFAFAYVFVTLSAAVTLYRRGAVLATSVCLMLLAAVLIVHIDQNKVTLSDEQAVRSGLFFFLYAVGLSLVAALASKLTETARRTGRELAQKEVALERLEEVHAAILRSLPAGLMTLAKDGTVDFANEAALGILNYRLDEVLGHSLNEMVPVIAGPWRRLIDKGLVADPKDRFEGNFSRADGKARRLGFSFAPLHAQEGVDPETIVVFQDVTDIIRLKEAAERAERLAMVGKLSAGLAHEVRNPLASMCASIDVLKSSLDPPDNLKRLMENVVREGERLNVLITDFLTFAKPREMRFALVDVSDLLHRFGSLFEQEVGQTGCRLELKVEPDLAVELDADMIRQVLWNLSRNAAQAMAPAGGVLTIEARSRSGGLEILVRDTGSGIPKETLRYLFDPFFSTKKAGTGLGLTIAHSIVSGHQGKILVNSEPGKGSEFAIWIPKTRQDALDFLGETDPSLDVTPARLDTFSPL